MFEPVLPDLHASPPQPLSFAPSLLVRAFLLRRDAGNVLIYSAATVAPAASGVEALGGVSKILLNHWHEAAFGGGKEVAAALSAPVAVHPGDAARTAESVPVAASLDGLGDDLEAIPIPGHTPGATAFLWRTDGHRVLFTGDSLFLGTGGEWIAAVLPSSDRDAYVAGLERLREVEFDLLVPWAAPLGDEFVARTDGADARRRIDAVLARVRRGAER